MTSLHHLVISLFFSRTVYILNTAEKLPANILENVLYIQILLTEIQVSG